MAKIFMVDDDPDFLQASKTILEKEGGYQVETALTVEEAEETLKKKKFDLIFLDIMMEDADAGIDLVRRIRKLDINTPIVMLSGVSKVTGFDYGRCNEVLPCTDFLEKPVTPKKLLEKVKEILEKK